MRFLLTLKPTADYQSLIFNYQYPFMSWIYGRLQDSDAEYAHFLHQNGYRLQDSLKTFKHFTFSNFIIPQFAKKIVPGDTCMWIGTTPIQVIVSFYLDKAAQDFIQGLFQDQTLSLYNHQHRANFIVSHVEVLPPVELQKTIHLQTISPIVVSRHREDHTVEYLHPEDPSYPTFFAYNLYEKYQSLHPHHVRLDPAAASQLIDFQLISQKRIKSRLLTIKENKKEATNIRAYTHFSFALSGPTDLLEVGFYGGFGRFSANGLGCCDLIQPTEN